MTEIVNEPGPWPRRRARAAVTRAQILRAATELFLVHGHAATTMPAIATAAGVSRATVFNSVGGKAAVLKASYDVAVVGDGEPVPIFQRPEMQAMFAEPNPERTLELYAAIIAGIGERISGLYEVFRAAAGADPEIATLWQQIQAERLTGATQFVTMLRAKAPLRPGLDPAAAADIVWVHIDNGIYHRFVHERGWSPKRFQAWFAETLSAQLFGRSVVRAAGPAPSPRPTRGSER
jgi:AcrR family transcriptional regulator